VPYWGWWQGEQEEMSDASGEDEHGRTRRRLLLGTAGALIAPWPRREARGSNPALLVGGLPVTCNLTLPIACLAAEVQARSAPATPRFEYSKYSGWPEIKESLMTGRIQAAYMLAPLVMDLADQGIPVKIVAIGHRSGAVIMVRTDSSYRSFKDLKGKRIAIPSRFAVDFLFLRKMLAKNGMTVRDVELVELAPPDMPAALYARFVDAYATGEPFGGVAQRAGYARLLSMTRDEWPLYMCCVLTVREELIKRDRLLVQQLVNYVLGAGIWLDSAQANRTRGVEIAARRQYFNQDVNVLRFVMENPADRVTYGDLKLVKPEFDEMMRLSIQAGTIKREIAYEKYADESFFRNARPAPIVLG
jgi:NitT/TauT family transport system substrate-binding protein